MRVGLPPLEAMFNSHGTAYAADAGRSHAIPSRFVLWFNGNGIPESTGFRTRPGADYQLTPCLYSAGTFSG